MRIRHDHPVLPVALGHRVVYWMCSRHARHCERLPATKSTEIVSAFLAASKSTSATHHGSVIPSAASNSFAYMTCHPRRFNTGAILPDGTSPYRRACLHGGMHNCAASRHGLACWRATGLKGSLCRATPALDPSSPPTQNLDLPLKIQNMMKNQIFDIIKFGKNRFNQRLLK